MRRRIGKLDVKFQYSILELHLKLPFSRIDGENGIPCVAVKCVDIWKNTCGVSGSLVYL